MRGLKLRRAAVAFLAGAITVTSAWAGASLAPSASDSPQATTATTAARTAQAPAPAAPAPTATPSSIPNHTTLPDGYVLAGAAKTSIEPRPEDYGGTWERSRAECAIVSQEHVEHVLGAPLQNGDHLASVGSPWPENPNCIYMGGFGIGPMNPVTSWNEKYGLYVRAVALRDKNGDDLVLAVIDGEGWFWDYKSKCADCGIKQITATLAQNRELGLEAKNIVIAATHAHSAPDFIGGWGFVPDWYMKQVTEAIKQTIERALYRMRPAVIEYGERMARPYNRERRSTYRSAEEQHLAWFRAYEPAKTSARTARRSKKAGTTIATVGAYAAHPVVFGTNGGEAHPDWPGLFEKSLEERFGGVGLHFMTGLGNMSPAGMTDEHKEPTGAADLAALIAGVGAGNRVEQPDIKTDRGTWEQPATNVPLTTLGSAGLFDREFTGRPAAVDTGKQAGRLQCTSASPTAAEVAASAARIGPELAFTAAPGEIFSNFSNTLKEQSNASVTFPLGQANDALGYMPQAFEMSPVGQQGLGFVDQAKGWAVVNYEDAYAVDRCFGDMALETSIKLLNGLK